MHWGKLSLPDLLSELIPDEAPRKNVFKQVGHQAAGAAEEVATPGRSGTSAGHPGPARPARPSHPRPRESTAHVIREHP